MNITRIGLDLAKTVFQIHGVDEHETVVLRRQLRRRQMLVFFAKLPPCLIGIEACASSHYWARELMKQGHTVKLIAPQFVKPYVKSQKNDANDAEAICEAVSRTSMRFVAIKTIASSLDEVERNPGCVETTAPGLHFVSSRLQNPMAALGRSERRYSSN